MGGDFLSSEDVELLESLASYIGIALQNAQPLCAPARKDRRVRAAEGVQREHRRVDQRGHSGHRPDDRIESWNAQMEAMYALSRGEALGQALRAVFPLEF
jgi:two-component system NtrC family sensor kinase